MKISSQSENSRIVEALKQGDEQTFQSIYGMYSTPLRTYATSILQDPEAAGEVVQEVFMAVWINRKKLDESKPLRNYLLRAVHNNALRMMQLEEARKLREQKAEQEQATGLMEEQESSRNTELLVAAIERLPEQSRKIIRMCYWEEKKSADIAQELSISIRTVETILYKAKKKLRGDMEQKKIL